MVFKCFKSLTIEFLDLYQAKSVFKKYPVTLVKIYFFSFHGILSYFVQKYKIIRKKGLPFLCYRCSLFQVIGIINQ